MKLNIADLPTRDRYKLMIGSILPRPIAWVSTMDEAGNLNLAPFSFFTAVCSNPMTVLFSSGYHAGGRKKDTWRNAELLGEFVVNFTNEETSEAMNRSATELSPGESEFAFAGVTPAASSLVRVPRVTEAPVAYECRLQQIVEIGDANGGGASIFGEVVAVHVRDDLYENGRIDLAGLKPIGRLSGNNYTRVNDIFTMKRLPRP
ncbi:MAG: flavin reductase family protein [Chloroflexota bacterium]